jgi:putative ABC transport system permease protein
MIRFLLKGLIRDYSRSLFPALIVAIGVMLTVFLHAYLNGAVTMVIQSAAHYSTGHVRVTTNAYAEEADHMPNDLALMGIDSLLTDLRRNFPDLHWTPRIKFGGLLDIPDEKGETRVQAPIFGYGVVLLAPNSYEWKILNIQKAIVKGRIPQKSGEILITDELAERLGILPGQNATLISSTMHGSMALSNFIIAGTVQFGIAAMDRGAIIADISDIQYVLDMQQSAGEIIGLFQDDIYNNEQAVAIATQFNLRQSHDSFSANMRTLRTEGGIGDYLDIVGAASGLIIVIFVLAMSIVLWNAGLTGNLRRYGEFGLRLAIGEENAHVYRSIIVESFLVGISGSLLGTIIGLAGAYYVQIYGINVGTMMERSTMMITNVIRAQVTEVTYLIGFLPGLLATLLGSALSGVGIYKRKTAQLFKELEV